VTGCSGAGRLPQSSPLSLRPRMRPPARPNRHELRNVCPHRPPPGRSPQVMKMVVVVMLLLLLLLMMMMKKKKK
jgi:hypothetical protein